MSVNDNVTFQIRKSRSGVVFGIHCQMESDEWKWLYLGGLNHGITKSWYKKHLDCFSGGVCACVNPFIHELVSQRNLNYSKWCQSWKWNQMNCSWRQSVKKGKMNGFSTCTEGLGNAYISHGGGSTPIHKKGLCSTWQSTRKNLSSYFSSCICSLSLYANFSMFVLHASVCWKRIVIIMTNCGCFVYISAPVKCYLQNILAIKTFTVSSVRFFNDLSRK